MSITEIYKQLLNVYQIVPIPTKLLTPSYPRWYNLTARSEYHIGVIGHSTETTNN